MVSGERVSCGIDSMSITYERDEQRRLITVTVTEPYSVNEILSAIDRQAAEYTWEYASLYKLAVTRMPTKGDVLQFADRIKAVGGERERGPVGLVVGQVSVGGISLSPCGIVRRVRTQREQFGAVLSQSIAIAFRWPGHSSPKDYQEDQNVAGHRLTPTRITDRLAQS
jgi:hypothetical protein